MGPRIRVLLGILLLAAGCYAGAALGLQAAVGTRSPVVSSAWPPAGIAVAALVLYGLRLAPGIALGGFLFVLLRGGSVVAALSVAAGATAAALAAAALLARVRFNPALARSRDVLAFTFIGAGLSATISASVRTFSLWWRGMLPVSDVSWTWLGVWAGDATGVLLVAFLIFVWASRSHEFEWRGRRWLEAGALALTTAVLTHLLFSQPSNYVYAIFPVVCWAALRFGPRGAATATFLVAAQGIAYTIRGRGPFAAALPVQDLFLLQIFIAFLAVTALILAASAAERRRAAGALRAQLRQQAALVDLGTRALAAEDLTMLLNDATALVARTLDAGFCKVLELTPDGKALRLRAGVGWKPGYVGHAVVPADGRSQAGHSLRSSEPVIVEDFAEEGRFDAPALLVEHSIVSGASVVVPGGDRPFGVLGCHSTARRRFGRDDAQFLQAAANVLGTTIQRRSAEEALGAARTRIRHLATSGTTVFYSMRVEGAQVSPTYISENVTRITGYTVDEALAPDWWLGHMHADDRERVLGDLPRLLAEGRCTFQYRFQFKNGEYHWMYDEGTVRRDADGGAPELVGSWIDITARKRTETLVTSLLDATPDGIVVSREDGRIVLVNGQAETLFGYGRQELLDRSIEMLVPERARGAHEGHRVDYFREPRARTMGQGLDLHGRRKDGSEFPVEISLSPMQSEDGLLVIAAVRDVSQRKSLEDRLRQSQRLEAVGQLAAGIAHDFNNLLTTIIGYGDLLREELGPSSEHLASLAEMAKAADHAALLTHQLLAFSRKQILQPKVLDPNAVVADMEAMLSRLIGEHIELRSVLNPAAGHVMVDPGQLEQVVLNLAVNARDAMPEGGTLTIETGNVDLDEVYASHHVGVKPGAYVRLTVSDTGVGMDDETRAHIFEPFFTTKARGEGTGLGLATIYGIAKQSGGNVWAYSERGMGSTFKVYLPRVDEAREEQAAPAPSQAAARGSETVLVVEDEAGVRSIVQRILVGRGYTVLQAANGADALAASAQHAGRIDLLLADVVLPQMSGRAIADALAAGRPDMKVLFMSGYTSDAIVHHGMLDAGLSFLQKPFTANALALKVREALDAPGTAWISRRAAGPGEC